MKSNVSNLDRGIRFLFGILVGLLYSFDVIGGTLAIVLGVVALIFFVTSLINFCPLYRVLGISTRKKKE
jgi:hypothetical protein